MRTVLSLIAALLTAAAVGAGPARAESSTGLYAPFPSAPGGDRAQRFVGELGFTTDRAALEHGVVLGVRRQAPTTAASVRAGASGDHPTTGLLVGAALALISVGASVAVCRARR